MEEEIANKSGKKTRSFDGYELKLLLTMTAVALLVNYVETMVLPGIPTIQTEFHTTSSLTSWITSAFLVIGAATAPIFGKLGDTYGKKKMFIIVLFIYIVGLVFAIFSRSIYELIIARAIQGMGFAVVPISLALLAEKLSPEKIGMAQGIISATFAIGSVLGLIIGAYIEEVYSWRDAFMIALVISILLFMMSFKVIKKDAPGTKVNIDYGGVAFLMAGITLCMVYITEGPTRGWLSLDNLAFVIPGLACLILFFIYEKRQNDPLIPLKLFKIRNILMANLIGLFSMMAMFLTFFGVTYYTQLPEPYGLGMTTIESGLTMAPAAICMLIIGPFAGNAVSRWGPKPMLIVGSLVGMTGMLLFMLWRPDSTAVTIDMIFTLVGVIMTMIPIINIITVSTPKENSTVSLGFNTAVRDVGGAIGPVLATTIMTSFVISSMIPIPSSTAFDAIFAAGVSVMVVMLALTLFVKNYSFGAKKTK